MGNGPIRDKSRRSITLNEEIIEKGASLYKYSFR